MPPIPVRRSVTARCRRARMPLAALAVAWIAALAAPEARPQPAAAPEPAAPQASARVGEIGPEIYYLEDDAGRLVPVPGFRYRDFVELFRLQEGLPGALEPPAAVLERIVVRARVPGPGADAAARTCPVTVECSVRQTRPGWVHVPLDLDGLLLDGPPRHAGPGALVVDTDPARGGLRAWFDAAPGAGGDVRHEIVLQGRLPLDSGPAQETVAMRLPAATASLVELTTPRDDPAVTVLPAAPAPRVETRPAADGSVVSIAALVGPVRIRLADRRADGGGWEAVPQCTVESVVRIDGRAAVTEATLQLENLPPGTTQLRVALPPRTTLRAVKAPAALAGRGGTPDAPTVEVAIDRDRAGAATVELECERPVDPTGREPFDVLGFAVEGIETWRQWGRVSLLVEGDWRAEWGDVSGLRRADPPASARREGFVAAFVYDAQPASLPIRVRPRRSRVVVEPEYRYHVGATRLALQARLRAAASGAPATSLTLDMDPTWDLDEVGPAGVVDTTAITIDAGRIVIPFLQPLAGEATVEVRASRSIDRATEALSWNLPVVRADLVAPAAVVVTSDSDIEVLPDAAASAGLVRQAAAGLVRNADSDRVVLAYRLDAAEGVFTATRRWLAQAVDATVAVRAVVDETEMAVRETIRLVVKHVPLETIDLAVPEEVAATETLEIRQDDALLAPFEVPSSADASEDAAPAVPAVRTVRALLPEPLLGGGVITITFRMPTPPVPPETTVVADLPVVLPQRTRVDRQSVVIETAETLAIDLRGTAWRRDPGPGEGPDTWFADRPRATVPLAVSARARAVAAGTSVEAAWLRTFAAGGRREDVASFVLDGNVERVSVPAPAAAAGDVATCAAWLDGVPVPVTRRAEGGTVIDLPRAAAGRRRVLEIRITAPAPTGWEALAARLGLPRPLALDAPAFGPAVAERRFFWEIAVRSDEALLGAPARWTSQQRWRSAGAVFAPAPAVTGAEIERWLAAAGAAGPAATAGAAPAGADHRAVYSGIGAPGAATLWIVPAWFIVLVASGAALAAGLAAAYLPWARRPAAVVPALAAVGLAAAAFPGAAPLFAQAAVPGAALAALAWVLRRWLERRERVDVERPPATISASSLTRALPAGPSLIVADSALRREGSVTAARPGR